MTNEKTPERQLTRHMPEMPLALQNAMKLLSDRNALNELVRRGDYRAIGNRIANLIVQMQAYRKTGTLGEEDRREIEQGIRRVLDLPSCSESEKPYLIQAINQCLVKHNVSSEYLRNIEAKDNNA